MKILSINTDTFFKKAINVAEYYGFTNIDELRKEAKVKGTSILGLHKHKSTDRRFEQNVLADMLKIYSESVHKRATQPLMFYTPSVVSPASSPSAKINALTLNTVGTNDPLAEVILLKSAMCILRELGIKNFSLKINSIGDKDSSVRFLREASSIVREKANELPKELSDAVRSNPGTTLAQLYNDGHPLSHELPSPIEYLTTPSRKYFKEVLELLDYAEVPFQLAEKLYADPNVYSHTIFEILEGDSPDTNTKNIILARGGRYDELTRPYIRGTMPSTGIVIAVKTKDKRTTIGRPRKKKANACLVHIGREARLRSIEIIEVFRERKIPIQQCQYFERFSDQMEYAQQQKTKFIIIIGQQEARDGVVLMRNTSNHSQHTIPITTLPDFLKAQ